MQYESKYAIGEKVQWDGNHVYGGTPQDVTIRFVTFTSVEPEVVVTYGFGWKLVDEENPDGLDVVAGGVPEDALSPLA